jgi:thymidylate synthase
MLHPPVFGRFEDAYVAVLEHVAGSFEHVNAPRGNAGRECLNVSFVVDNPRDRIVYNLARRTNIVFCFAEALWYLQGRDDLEMIGYYAPRLARFSADGQTLTGSAYGARLFQPAETGTSQWERVTDLLTGQAASKRAVVSFFQPGELADPASPDVSCTLALQFLLRDDRLHAVTYMRGNDAVIGLLCDVFSFTLLQEFTANRIGARLGSYGHHVGSMHINDTDTAQAAAIIAGTCHASTRFPVPVMPLTGWTEVDLVGHYEEVLRHDELHLDTSDPGWLGLKPYWQQVVLLFEVYRQISHHPGCPVTAAALKALDPGYRWLVAHRWPGRIPEGVVMPARRQR